MGILISFSGIDGAGKSTQIKLLKKYLVGKGKKTYITEEMFGYFLLKPLIGLLRSVTGSPSKGPVKRNRKALLKLWFIPAFADIWLMHFIKIRPMLKKYDVVIADRYYYDIWANLLYYGYVPNWAFHFFLKRLPGPDNRLFLKVGYKTVLKREAEFPPEYYKEQAKIYDTLSGIIQFYQLDASDGPKEVFRRIKNGIR